MHDMSDRFLFQLMADHRESLQRSGRAATRRPFRRALRAGLARLGLAPGRFSSTQDRSNARGDAHWPGRSDTAVQDGPTASGQDIGTSDRNGRRDDGGALVHRELQSGSAARVGDSVLTRREHQVVLLVAEGMTNAEIARTLWISPGTVRRHLENVFAKLGVHTRTAAVAKIRAVEPRS